jgi:LPXTG-site transpeptidase (sortase) family protein
MSVPYAVNVISSPVEKKTAMEAPPGTPRVRETIGQPRRLLIPSIGVDAHIESVGRDEDGSGAMGVPSNFTNVGWFNEGPLPGLQGSAVIAGHLSGKKVPKAVFYQMHTLKVDDVVEVLDSDENLIRFKVTGVRTYAHNDSAADVFTQEAAGSYLNLITCSGRWLPDIKLFEKRTVVFTKRIDPS